MALTLGKLEVKILAQVGDSAPIEIGTMDIPLRVTTQATASGAQVTVIPRLDPDILEANAKAIEDELKRPLPLDPRRIRGA